MGLEPTFSVSNYAYKLRRRARLLTHRNYMNCITCQKETNNPKFCSRTCSAITTNKTHPRRKLNKTCSKCSCVVKSYRHNLCVFHFEELNNNKTGNNTIEFYIKKNSIQGKHKSWKFVHIRSLARNQHKHILKLPCAKCGYSKHVELAHIRAISSFPITTKIKEVNSADNVIQLCPNCHWELDNTR